MVEVEDDGFCEGSLLADRILSGEISVQSVKGSGLDGHPETCRYSLYRRLFEGADIFMAYEFSWAFRNDDIMHPITRAMLVSHEADMFDRLGMFMDRDLVLGDMDPSNMFRPNQEF